MGSSERVKWWVIIFVVALVIFSVARVLYYYELPGKRDMRAYPEIIPKSFEPEPSQAAGKVAGKGKVLFDMSHKNRYSLDEDYLHLHSTILDLGYAVSVHEENASLPVGLMNTEVFIIAAPTEEFQIDEIEATVNFVEKGGRVLILVDDSKLNDLTQRFKFFAHDDYLYNLHSHHLNFRNIYIPETEELGSGSVLFTACSLDAFSGSSALTFASPETDSSVSKYAEKIPLIVQNPTLKPENATNATNATNQTEEVNQTLNQTGELNQTEPVELNETGAEDNATLLEANETVSETDETALETNQTLNQTVNQTETGAEAEPEAEEEVEEKECDVKVLAVCDSDFLTNKNIVIANNKKLLVDMLERLSCEG